MAGEDVSKQSSEPALVASEPITEAVRRLRNEIYLFSAAISGIIAAMHIFGKIPPTEALLMVGGVYLLGLYLVHGEKRSEMRKAFGGRSGKLAIDSSSAVYQVHHPESFPDPFSAETDTVLDFDLTVAVTNKTQRLLKFTAFVNSPTQAVAFEWDEDKPRKDKRKYGLIPSKKKTRYWLNHMRESGILPNETENLVFHGVYRRQYAIRLAVSYSRVPLEYRLVGFGAGQELIFDTGMKRLEIPLATRKENE